MGWVAGVMMMAAAQAAPAAPMAGMAGMEHPATVCPATPAPLPPELAGWTRMVPVAAGAAAGTAATLVPGTGAKAALLPTPKVAYATRPEKPGGPLGSGGLFAFAVPAAGRYRVAIGSGAWIDVVRDGKPVASVGHGHGPDCSEVRKMVDFDLSPGRYLLQISNNDGATLPLMVAHVP